MQVNETLCLVGCNIKLAKYYKYLDIIVLSTYYNTEKVYPPLLNIFSCLLLQHQLLALKQQAFFLLVIIKNKLRPFVSCHPSRDNRNTKYLHIQSQLCSCSQGTLEKPNMFFFCLGFVLGPHP